VGLPFDLSIASGARVRASRGLLTRVKQKELWLKELLRRLMKVGLAFWGVAEQLTPSIMPRIGAMMSKVVVGGCRRKRLRDSREAG